jgi:hypothetical protein
MPYSVYCRLFNGDARRSHTMGVKRYNRESMEHVEQPERTAHRDEEPMLYCPVCSLRLIERHCKLLCEKCGYYMSCADFY